MKITIYNRYGIAETCTISFPTDDGTVTGVPMVEINSPSVFLIMEKQAFKKINKAYKETLKQNEQEQRDVTYP